MRPLGVLARAARSSHASRRKSRRSSPASVQASPGGMTKRVAGAERVLRREAQAGRTSSTKPNTSSPSCGANAIAAAAAGRTDAHLGKSCRRLADCRLLRFAAMERRPMRVGRDVPQEALPAEAAAAVDSPFGKLQLMVGEGLVKRRTGDFDHLQPGRAFEHAMADLRAAAAPGRPACITNGSPWPS